MATTNGSSEVETAASSSVPSASRRSRLSVSHANALANFDLLAGDLSRHRLVVFLDYDGTLTPIVNDPASARLAPEMRLTLQRLQQHGRSLSKIQQFVNIPELYYAGSHGFDIVGPNGTWLPIRGAEIEDNIYSVSLHYRNVDPSQHEQIATIVQDALRWVSTTHEEVFTIYIGDDTTDEDAFDVFRVGIIVTDHSKSTGASFTLHDTQEVYQFLNRLADLQAPAT
ncbi:hypothetical protein PINS_up018745 [Pythium insidiosum]|nr:hypothetical protein PINS_up018745 [Pythium insidiosum]